MREVLRNHQRDIQAYNTSIVPLLPLTHRREQFGWGKSHPSSSHFLPVFPHFSNNVGNISQCMGAEWRGLFLHWDVWSYEGLIWWLWFWGKNVTFALKYEVLMFLARDNGGRGWGEIFILQGWAMCVWLQRKAKIGSLRFQNAFVMAGKKSMLMKDSSDTVTSLGVTLC